MLRQSTYSRVRGYSAISGIYLAGAGVGIIGLVDYE